MLECANGDSEFLKIVITGDEMWVYRYDLETKVQSSQWKHSSSPRLKKSTTSVEQSQGAADCFL
jgi:outer membrane lipoprotein-sorting protein